MCGICGSDHLVGVGVGYGALCMTCAKNQNRFVNPKPSSYMEEGEVHASTSYDILGSPIVEGSITALNAKCFSCKEPLTESYE